MSVRIASNVSSLNAQRRLGDATRDLSKVSERLSSGLRIDRASDDAAGLQIAEDLRSDSKVFGQAIRNVNDGLSLLNIAQGATEQLSNIVTRHAELAEQAINGTYSYKQRLAMNAEAAALTREYNRIIQTTSFNGIQTLEGVTNSLRMQLGYGENGGIQVGVGNNIGFAAGSGEFGAASGFDVGERPFSVKVSDFNGDGVMDIVTADRSVSSPTVSVLLGNGDGSFLARQSFDVGQRPYSVSVSDLNGDGVIDLVSADYDSNTVSVLLGNGDGSFAARQSFATGITPSSVSISDLNGDGLMDLISTDMGSATVSVFWGNGDGSFLARRSFDTGSNPFSVSVSDFNGDGMMDLVSADAGSATLSVLLGNGNGSFLARQSFATGLTPASVSVSDFNGDGVMDLVSADNSSSSVSVLLGNGNGSFLARQSFATGSGPFSASVSDFNGDGVMDLISADDNSDTLSVLLGNGDGSFRARQSFNTGDRPVSVSVSDFNGDGVMDVVNANWGTGVNSVNVFLGQTDSSGRRNNRLADIDLTTKYGAKQALASSKAALTRIGAELGSLGAMQSRLSVAGQTLLTSRENYDAARSQLVDADIAQESASLVRARILQQAVTAVLGQANQQPTLALRLLGQG